MTKKSPFDYVNSIDTKTPIEFEDSEYMPFMVNRAFSQHLDSVLFANEMNKAYELPKKMQYDFYYYGLSARKRYGKWHKKDNNDEDVIQYLYKLLNLNRAEAKHYLSLLSEEEKQNLLIKMSTGVK